MTPTVSYGIIHSSPCQEEESTYVFRFMAYGEGAILFPPCKDYLERTLFFTKRAGAELTFSLSLTRFH